MKKLLLQLIVILCMAVPAMAQAPAPAAADPFHDWLIYYYINKDITKVPDFLQWLQTNGKLEKYPSAVPSIEGFLEQVFADNSTKATGWVHAVNFTGKTKIAVTNALKASASLKILPILSSTELDKSWGGYFASGDTNYLRQIVAILDNQQTGKKYDALRAAAIYSLGANMTQHESVDRFLQTESTSRTGATGDALKQIVAGVVKQRQARAFPDHAGDFSAAIFVTDPKLAQEELAKTTGEVIHFKEMSHVKSGDNRAVLIVFAGQQLTPDYMSDVTYKLQITDPEGKVFTDQKDLEAIKQKLPTRFRIFTNKAVVFVKFDDKDAVGVYKISATLSDNVGKTSIPLNTTITLQK